MTNFWKDTSKPLFMLAPMEDVTDTSFREAIVQNSDAQNLHVVFTEFTSTDGLCHPVGRDKVATRLKVSHSEAILLKKNGVKIVAQIWGNSPEKYSKAVKFINDHYNFDGIDINMGCPVRNVVRKGSCSALIDNPALAGEIIQATREATNLPISVKTRMGTKQPVTEKWVGFLLEQSPDAIILHGRTQKQMSDGEANWDEIEKAVQLRNHVAPSIKIIGNGDIDSIHQAKDKVAINGVDGVMIGRGIFKDPWLFSGLDSEPSIQLRLATLKFHLLIFKRNWGATKNFAILKRFFKIYLSGFKGAAELRAQAMQTNSFDEVLYLLKTASAGFEPVLNHRETLHLPHPLHPQTEVAVFEDLHFDTQKLM